MDNNKLTPGKGKLLIAEPLLSDHYFSRSVVLLVDHNSKEGSYGVIINKPTKIKLNEVLPNTSKFNLPLYLGGPVRTDNLYAIHTLGKKINKSSEIIKGLYWGGDYEMIKELISKNKIKPNEITFFIGYSSWEPNQLDKEMKENSWIVANAEKKHFSYKSPQTMWRDIMKNMGNENVLWANAPIDPGLN